MTLPVFYTSQARADLARTLQWYEDCAPNLIPKLMMAVEHATARIGAFPAAGAKVGTETRRAPVRGFPLGLYYLEEDHGIVVVAVEHHRRAPHDWK